LTAASPKEGPDAFPVIRWEALLDAYRPVRPADDCFLGMLELALDLWPTLAAQPASFGANAELHLSGLEILARRADPLVRMVGRRGGRLGSLFQEDVASGGWQTRRCEVSSAKADLADNPNWFTVEEFVTAVKGA
jgi:hypothetical protein